MINRSFYERTVIFVTLFYRKTVDSIKSILYNTTCVVKKSDAPTRQVPGCGSAWLERLVWDQEVAGSNPVTPMSRVIIYAGVVQW